MFAYCNNNPTNYYDPTGTCKNTFSYYLKADCGSADCTTSAAWKGNAAKKGVTFTRGKYVSVNLWVLNITASVDLAVDTQGNVQPLLSVTKDLNASGKVSASLGDTHGLYFFPDTSDLCKNTRYTYNLGGGYSVPIPGSPIAISASGNIVVNAEGDIGIVAAYGPSTISASGAEWHIGIVDTYPLLPQINIPDILEKLF